MAYATRDSGLRAEHLATYQLFIRLLHIIEAERAVNDDFVARQLLRFFQILRFEINSDNIVSFSQTQATGDPAEPLSRIESGRSHLKSALLGRRHVELRWTYPR